MPLQEGFKRRSRVWSRGRRGIVLIRSKRRRLVLADRRDDPRGVERITSWTPHGSPSRLFSTERKANGRLRVHLNFDGIGFDRSVRVDPGINGEHGRQVRRGLAVADEGRGGRWRHGASSCLAALFASPLPTLQPE
jgi:hypothetical protein